ncbi:FadR/GntR family transcriptional regulator [Salibacterium aidingense]|uniref:FadR/GntR family transcriptional regulator n=1 Tax=Salibacterium aidingense TaxID=384933 RepID=UPI00041BA77B|nr:FCD domain-containing protein [Salibacterium aidingense]
MSKIQYQKLLNEITRKIEDKEWTEGSKMPTITKLASQYNIGNSTVREVFRTLETKGYVSIQQGRGTFVSYDGTLQFTNISRSSFIKLHKLTEFRSIIEPSFAAMAAKQAYMEEIDKIVESARIMAELAENNEITNEEDLRFHRLIVQATHNEYSIKVYENLQEELRQMRALTKKPGMIEKAVHYHQMISQSIANRDPYSAEMYMKSHMETNSELAIYQLTDNPSDY